MLWPVEIARQQEEIRKTWNIFHVEKGSRISMRALWPKAVAGFRGPQNITFTPEKYPDIADRRRAFETTALKLNAQGYNIYIVMNLIDADFDGNETNKLAVGDTHISRRRYLLIDLDRAKTDQPATDDEIAEVLHAALDGAIEVERSANSRFWSAAKVTALRPRRCDPTGSAAAQH